MQTWWTFAVALTLVVACAFRGDPARADDEERAVELKVLINRRDDVGVRKFFEGIKPADRKGVIREYAKKETLDESLAKLLGDLQKAFGDIDDPDKSGKPYSLYLNTILKGMKDPDGVSYQDLTLYIWAAREGRNVGKPVPRGKQEAMKVFFAELGIKSGKEYTRLLKDGEPKEALTWHNQFMKTFAKKDAGVSDQLFLQMVFDGN
jgi:hypothetical protein